MTKRAQLRYRLPTRDDQPRFFTTLLQSPNRDFLEDRRVYTYKFQPARRQNDPIIRLIYQAIASLNQHPDYGYLMCNSNIRVFPSTNAPPIWPPNKANSNDVKLYTFCQDDKEFPATAPVSVIPRELPPTVDKVHVRQGGEWIPLIEWMLQLADTGILIKRSIAQSTYLWHRRSKQQFRLMDLPVELRLLIFERIIAPTGEVYPLSQANHFGSLEYTTQQQRKNAHIILGLGYSRDCSILSRMMWVGDYRDYVPTEDRVTTPPPNLNLLFVSKAVNAEALRAGWEGVKRCFIDHKIFAAVADSKVGVAQRFNCLGRIQLSFDNAGWFDFFGVKVGLILEQTQSESLGHYLSRLNHRASLEIRFRDPSDGAIGDPWYGRGDTTIADCPHPSCQTVLIDWILALAYQHIKHIRDVRIVGCVRKPQKQKWQAILGKRMEYDNDAALAAMFATPSTDL
jgi:hypothetical protein